MGVAPKLTPLSFKLYYSRAEWKPVPLMTAIMQIPDIMGCDLGFATLSVVLPLKVWLLCLQSDPFLISLYKTLVPDKYMVRSSKFEIKTCTLNL